MATIKPFQAYRPRQDLAGKIAALPYDVMNREEAAKAVEGNPYSFLHVDKAEIDLPDNISPYDQAVYERARDNLNKLIEQGALIQDTQPCLYIYSLTMQGREQTGLVCLFSIDEYEKGIIKKHELTREDKEKDRINHVETCNAHTGPIFMAYRAKAEATSLIEEWKKNHAAVYALEFEQGVSNKVWVINDPKIIESLSRIFAEIPSLYIADGHHRNAAAVKCGQRRRMDNPAHTGEESYNYYLGVAFPGNELKILDYNRVVKVLNGLSAPQFLAQAENHFIITPSEIPVSPESSHAFGMYLNGKWYCLKAKPSALENKKLLQLLDVSILQDELLNPVLGIQDPRTDHRIDFVGGIRGLGELEKRVDSGEMQVAFSMFPTTIDELMDIADQSLIMPPKSTWFEPKLRSGLFIHKLED